MGRKVFITSDMSTDEALLDIAELDPKAALIWPWILTFFNDWGRAEAKPKEIKAKIFPLNELISYKDIETALKLYHQFNLITLYQVDNKKYMYIDSETWFDYQTHIHKTKRSDDSGSKIPAPVVPTPRESAEVREESREIIPSPSTLPPFHPSPSINNNNNNAHEDIESEIQPESDSPALEHESRTDQTMGLGTRAVRWAEEKWGRMLSPKNAEDIIAWCDEFSSRGSPDPDGVVIKGLEYCNDAGARNMYYLRTVLTDWREAGVLTVEQVLAREAERKKGKEKRGNNHPREPNPPKGPNPPKVPSGKYDDFYLS